MLFTNKDLYNCFGLSEATYFRRVRELKRKKKFVKKTNGHLLSESEARTIADALQLNKEFERFLQSKQKRVA